MPGQYLHPDRQSFGGCAARNAHARNARQAAGDGVDVGEVHGDRVVHLLPQLESREGRNRRHDRIHLLKRVREIARDQRAHLLRLQIVRVVIAVAKHVSAQHDAPFAFGAEALAARVAVHVRKRLRVRRAVRITYAIVPRQVRAGFSRRDDVIARDGIIGGRKADFAELAAELPAAGPRPREISSPVSLVKSFRYSRGSPSFNPFTLPSREAV